MQSSLRVILLGLLLLATCVPSPAGDAAARIGAYLAKRKFNGVVLVSQSGKVVFNQAYGLADYKTKRRLTVDSVFNLASVSKQFTAMAVMILNERGRLRYDAEVRSVVPGFPYAGITIRNLLHHTSGLPDYFEIAEAHWDESRNLTNQDVLALLKKYGGQLDFKPGSKHDYSNTGYAVLASVIEVASGKSYAEFLREAIFAPLGMTSTFVYSPRAIQSYASRRAYGYASDWTLDDMSYLDGVVGDGGIYSTTGDLFRWDRGLAENRLVKETTLREAFTSGRTTRGKAFAYGFGWNVEDGKVWHDGSWAGFRTSIVRVPDDGDSVIILNNNSNENLDEIDTRLEKILGSP
ncbi:MAG: beta-lactamase family protein [Armatimonadetes bacterium]|nr:beta-lactamase family protein [Armatimonadota bacterium]